tara:strand:- start:153 stop:512 length:360 start_codon:yes stop_codon:yes gene_type:complete
MLTLFKQIFVWWNQQTLGTKIYTIIFGKFVGKDDQGNRYYESKSGKRWIIYQSEVESTKISREWYSWIHYMPNKIEKNRNLKTYNWEKPFVSNQTGTKDAYHPRKNENIIKKKYKSWKD